MKVKESNNTFENPFFVATVVDNNDPTFNYRIKVRLDHLHEAIEDKDLPWAAKLDSSFMGMDGTHSLHSVPEVGSKVLVITVANNPNSLLYMGCLYKKSDSTPSGDNYLNSYGIYNKDGEYIKLDKIQKLLELVWAGKININKITEMNITINGNVNLTTKGNITTNTDSNFVLNAKSNITTNTDSNFVLNAKSNITATANSKVNITGTAGVDITGNTTIKGTLDVSGLVKGAMDIRANGGSVGLLTHTHPGVFPGPSATATGQG